ncbi:GTPase Era involved in 16S rRNA processing [Virgibacillus natechei]|uniref:GTPase Era involved in 16S rRNA processing n=1 Tax=Virgibacillus natechei TaxID=1216297 RepID=A0ABS4IAH6_9BACI|nr:dynamin family protein [Virgibacillus natechei]MBP1967937.1 GTPase Era involved in 16S rRNA processing [Virgibacillus natechei]UZD14911.1 dynamin family protein [Virgibacillus natechei]
MIKSLTRTRTELPHLVALYKQMVDNKDKSNATKILDIYEKLEKEELIISFAGHFSAGKSSMINALLAEDILPKSPIPTSANVVKINSGEGMARVFFKHSNPLAYKEPYDIDRIKEYSKEEDTIEKIEISTGKKVVPEGSAIIDTPGIDAADDADRLMTEGSLYLVDILFYVMDYNHVQSEVNLQFLKSLQEKGIPFYVIINQIDKHDETEISFNTFDNSIKQTFDLWGLYPQGTFYCSLLYPAENHNQFNEIKRTLFSLMSIYKDEYLNIDRSVTQVMKEHKHYLKTKYEDEMDNDATNNESQVSMENINNTETKLHQLKNEPLELEKAFNSELQKTLQNAYLMPSSIRDNAAAFLESQQYNFKVGLLATKKKTAEEKDAREAAFLNPLLEIIEASVQWRLRDKFINLLKENGVEDHEVHKRVQRLSIIYSREDLIKLMKTGAKVNGDYILNYTNDVAADIKSKYKQEARLVWKTIHQAVTDKNEETINIYETHLSQLQEKRALQLKKDDLQTELDEKYSRLDKQLEYPENVDEAQLLIQNDIESRKQTISLADDSKENKGSPTIKIKKEEVSEVKTKREKKHSVDSVLDSIDKTLQTIADLPGFQTLTADLNGKYGRLIDRTYTIALFGAFSAGKSSFANALLGERVLPSSPNPTTATVNRIRPVTKENSHGTVIVTLKDENTLRNDILMVTKNFSPIEADFKSLVHWVEDKQIHKNVELNKMYQSYLQAIITGFDKNKDSIGNTVRISIEEFASYVTDETRACYIDSIDLYYDCSITKQGITLVDTPGADSVNARHTNVAFDYIKHADAILYITYYNHALSRADKDFLIQLGRVKEAFQLDKMFFVVNAADLASNDEELKLVTSYVQDQLVQLGIRFPRLFAVSSKQSLKNKLNNLALNKQMRDFEDDFYHFIHSDLTELTVKAALWDIKRAHQTMEHYRESLNLNAQEKERHQRDLLSKRDHAKQQLLNLSVDVYKEQVSQKIDKQLFYVLERISIRFHDMFKETFNPATITESGRKAQMQLRNSLQNLIEYVGFELVQELQAVSLRVEAFIQSQATDVYKNLAKSSKQIDETFILPEFDQVDLNTPYFINAFQNLDILEFDQVLAKFNGTKAFFAKNEKEVMKEQFQTIMKPYEKEYIEENKSIMDTTYVQHWDKLMDELKNKVIKNLDAHINNYLEIMESPVNGKHLTEKHNILDSIMDKHDIRDVQ